MASLIELRVRHLRALDQLKLAPEARANLITGLNGAGKTTVLEAIFLLSRGRSFRGSDVRQLIRHGESSASAAATVVRGGNQRKLTLSVTGKSLGVRVDGEPGIRKADLARLLPVLNLDARVMDLIDRGPERRRLLLNWVAFHVEPSFNVIWRRFRRALKQRNSSLRKRARAAEITAWDGEFSRAGEELEQKRRLVAERLRPRFNAIAAKLLGLQADWDYYRGWGRDKPLGVTLREGLARDRKQGSTCFGPQRSDLVLRLETRRARYMASRGQQKMLAAALMLAAAELLEEAGCGRPVLLVDEPLAELDSIHAEKLLHAICERECQMFLTAVDSGRFRRIVNAAEFRLREGALV